MVEKTGTANDSISSNYVKSNFEDMVFQDSPHIDALTSALTVFGAELWASRRRGYIIEALLEANKPVTKASIAAYVPTPAEEKAWKGERDRLINALYAPFLRGTAEFSFSSEKAISFDPHEEPKTAMRPPLKVGNTGTR